MNDNGNDESILKLFQEYKKFCHNKINDQNSTKDVSNLYWCFSCLIV